LSCLTAAWFSVAANNAPSAVAQTSCNGKVATLVGTDVADTLAGTAGADVIVALGGDDRVDGGGGNDTICGGDGNDVLLGGVGADWLDGETGDFDFVQGDAGNDVVSGGAGAGDAALFSGALPVTANLASGLASGVGNDTLSAFEGLIGSSAADHLYGDDATFNFFVGGAGNDVMDGRGGTNAVLYTLAPQAVSVNLGDGSASGDGLDTLIGIQGLAGSPFDDSLTGGARTDVILGDTGNDALRGAGGRDQLLGNEGDDTVYGDAADDFLVGGPGNDGLDGGSGSNDAVLFDSATGPITASLAAGTATGDGVDSLSRVESLVGSQAADSLTGNGASNRIAGLAGADILYGKGGSDLLVGGEGSDIADGGRGSDYCVSETARHCEVSSGGPSGPGVTTALPTSPPSNSRPPVREQASKSARPSTLSGLLRTLGGSTAATDVAFSVWGPTINPVQCYQADRRVSIPSSSRAQGAFWNTYLYYWHYDGSAWQLLYTGASTGWLHPERIYVPGFLNGSFGIVDYWDDVNGQTVQNQGYNVGTEGDFYFLQEYATDSAGNQTLNQDGGPYEVIAPGGSYYSTWCELPRA
jgi:Ca2+-binding RTX toxin-like protein